MIERERKFLLADDSILSDDLDWKSIWQGYLMLDKGKQLRVRVIGNEAYICYKAHVSDTDRNEFEYEIPYEDGLTLFESCAHKLKKGRYYLESPEKGIEIIVDDYLHGLKVVEIEYETELTDIPAFCGPEITGIKEYSNIAIAQHGWSI